MPQKSDTATDKQKSQADEQDQRKSSSSASDSDQSDAQKKKESKTKDSSHPAPTSPVAEKKLKSNTKDPVKKALNTDIQPQKVIANEKVPIDQYASNSGLRVAEYNGEQFTATLNFTDTSGPNKNQFYIIQVLVNQNTKEYFTFNRWGRIGVPGQHSEQGPLSASQAIQDFNQQKTQKIKGGYIQIFIDYGDEEEVKQEEEEEKQEKSDAPDGERLQKEVEILIGKIFNGKMMDNSIRDLGYDPKKMPLGQLATRTINEAYQALDLLQKAIKEDDQKQMQEQANQFFSLIPHDIGFRKTSDALVLKTQQEILKKLDMLKDLSDMKIAAQMMSDQGATDSQSLQNYKKLQNKINVLDTKSEDYKIIEQLIEKTQGHYKLSIKHIYTLDREGEASRFTQDIGNDYLLWHGSGMSNFVGILSQGLRIAPPEAPASGYNYGQGVYFADLLQQSTDYTRHYSTQGDILLLLCQVAVGKPNVLERTDSNASKLPAGCNSTLGWGSRAPDETENKYIDAGKTRVPVGQLIQTQSQNHMGANQYIIYNEAQAKMRFLVNLQVEGQGY